MPVALSSDPHLLHSQPHGMEKHWVERKCTPVRPPACGYNCLEYQNSIGKLNIRFLQLNLCWVSVRIPPPTFQTRVKNLRISHINVLIFNMSNDVIYICKGSKAAHVCYIIAHPTRARTPSPRRKILRFVLN